MVTETEAAAPLKWMGSEGTSDAATWEARLRPRFCPDPGELGVLQARWEVGA